ncbi:MAG: hypothetical protein HY335_04375 [Deinococcus sp.]|nr:hypothetical protein [Deinococcus sp.]
MTAGVFEFATFALRVDSHGKPRAAFYTGTGEGGTFPPNYLYAWCDANCEASAQSWRDMLIEPSERVTQELPIPPYQGCAFPLCNPPIPPCTLSAWNDGVRPSLALDATGNPYLAYDADHEQGGGCRTFTDTRLTRFVAFTQP